MTTNINTILNWFKTGKKPTQVQFWTSWQSFWHKDETIPQDSINNLVNTLNTKVEKSQFDNHKTDKKAHITQFESKEDKAQKGVAYGYAPLDSFTKVASQYLNIVNDLVTGGSTSLLSAEQGIILQNQIKNINILLTSDNVDLNTLQKIIDAIEAIQLTISNILINDLTTGGTTKALTAEMGKTLKSLIDTLTITAASKEDISNKSTNITDDSSSNIKYPSVKAVFNWVLSNFRLKGQNITYVSDTTYTLQLTDINATIMFSSDQPVTFIIPPQVAVEFTTGHTIKYIQTGNGTVTLAGEGINFTTNLSLTTMKGETRTLTRIGENIWSVEGQESFEKDIKLSNYLSTRNDGQLPTNKILSTDENGNLKMYTIALAPAPYLDMSYANSYLPNTTSNIILKGSFFTPTMTVEIQGQTVNYITFKSDNEIHVNVTTGSLEGNFNITLNNGISQTFANALNIVLGTVYSPIESEWENITGAIDLSEKGSVRIATMNSVGKARWKREIDYTKNFSIRFNINKSPLGYPTSYYDTYGLSLHKVSNNSEELYNKIFNYKAVTITNTKGTPIDEETSNHLVPNNDTLWYNWWLNKAPMVTFEIRSINGILYCYIDNSLIRTFSKKFTENVKIVFTVGNYDIANIKYIELAT